jgi:anaerobic ribonucleoside-triphosphate reductase|uniref:Anaerobic ribonucleoside triphosphate reductase n=1 Tax=Siphoviridae sp. ctmpG14 TaxID=2825654 RepID=A0A8S5PAK0_9CAUD|nr:MAG TPA: anaerobic ribonucleoside triphosphate reductase [Siphoviridae sp. ctmpG14]
MITSIIKRDGSIEPFNPEKIVIAISKAGSATGEFDTQVSKELVRSMVLPRVNAKKGRAVSVEDVQDIVENVLFDTAFEKSYKAYTLYREDRRKSRETKKALIDVEKSMNEYLRQDDWRVKANANQGYSLGGMILNISGKITANYWLNNVYPEEVGVAHRNGDYHIHDLDMLSGYCAGWSLRSLLNEGFNGVANKVESNPPKHVSSALLQMVNFLGSLQNEWAGAQAFSSFDTYLAPFVRVDKLSYEELKQRIQEFIYNLNVPSRWGCVLPSTKVLTTENKWKGFDELTTKDKVWSINQQGYLCQSAIKVVIKKPYDGLIYELPNDAFNYRQTVTAEHRVYVKNDHSGQTVNPAPYIVKTAQKIAEEEKEVWVPYSIGASGEESWEDWTSVNEALAGAKPHPPINIQINKISCRHYQGDVWCPSVTEGNVIFKDEEGHVFLSGQTQTPFTNLTFDIHCPEDIRDDIPLIGGKEVDFKYGDLQKEMDMINKAYMEVMIAGDAHGRIFTFPIPTYNISKDFDWDSANSELLFEMTAKYGLPYFQNFINSELKPNQIRSMCCRLQLDLRELLKRGNGLFGSAEQTGSVGVVTINCARLGYVFKGDKEGLYKRLDYLMGLAKTSLEIKRKEVQKHMDQGLFPFTKRYLGTLRNHFSTIGVNGINEMIRNFTNDKFDITSEEGHAFAIEFLDHVRAKMVEYQEETGNLYNLEATPAEGTTYRFAKEDKKRWPDIIQAGTTKNNYYTNSSQLPVGFTDDPFEALEMQDDLQRKYTGGTVLHLYMGERISTSHACKELVKRALTHFKLPYITITPTFSICPKHGYIAGEHKFCPLCDDELVAKKKRALLKCQKAGTGK